MKHKITVEVDEYGIPLKYSTGVSYPLHRFSYDYELSKIAQYIPLGVDINCRDKQGRTPLHEACCIIKNKLTLVQDELLIVKFLVENGADVMAIDYLGETPLHCVARHRTCRSIASYLVIECKVPLTCLNAFGQTPLDVAKESSDSLFKNLKVKPEALTAKSNCFASFPEVLQFLLLHTNPSHKSLRELAKECILFQLKEYDNEKLNQLILPKHLKCYLGGKSFIDWIKQREMQGQTWRNQRSRTDQMGIDQARFEAVEQQARSNKCHFI